MWRRRALTPLWLLVLGIAAATCSAPVRQYDIRRSDLSCAEANELSYKTMKAMGFAVGRFDPAAPGHRGVIQGRRQRQAPDSGEQYVTVTIACAPTGVSVDAREDGQLFDSVDLKRPFYQSFTNIISMDAARREITEKIDAGTAPPSQQRGDLQVLLEPIRGQEAKLYFDLDLAAGGVLPVRVTIANRTQRAYRLDPGEVHLTRADRKRAAPLAPAEAAARVAQARDAKTGAPPSTLSEAQVRERLSEHLFSATGIEPGARVDGFLYFPLAEYLRGRVLLTERESEEAEGFLVEF